MSDTVFTDAIGRQYRVMPGRPRQQTTRIQVRILTIEWEALRTLAALNQTTVADMVRDAINEIAADCGQRRVFPPSRAA